jgi:Sec-independent protein secretion pathway component TatC
LNKFKFLFQTFILIWIFYSFVFYKILIPFSWDFFLNFQQNDTLNQPISLFFEAKLFDFLSYFINFYNLGFLSGIFLIVIVFFLNRLARKRNQIKNFRKIFYLIFLVFSTLITPPDVFSQITITFYLILMNEIIIFLNYLKIN